MEIFTTSRWGITSMRRMATCTARCPSARRSTETAPSTLEMRPLRSMQRSTRVRLENIRLGFAEVFFHLNKPYDTFFDPRSSSVLHVWCLLLFFSICPSDCIEYSPKHHPSPEDIMSHFTLHFKRFVCNLFVSWFWNTVCVCVGDELLSDPNSALFQVGLCHGHIYSQGHKLTDRETSGAARLLRLHYYCMWHISKEQFLFFQVWHRSSSLSSSHQIKVTTELLTHFHLYTLASSGLGGWMVCFWVNVLRSSLLRSRSATALTVAG